jgi:hypothetical protein
MKQLLDFYAEVKVGDIPDSPEISGKQGVIIGRAEQDGRWSYAVWVEGVGELYHVTHEKLTPTGRQFRREDFYGGESIRVRVDKNGDGTIVGK